MKLLNCEIQVQDPDRAVLNISMYEINDCEKGFYEKGLHLSLLCKISCCSYCLSSFSINEYSAPQKYSPFKYIQKQPPRGVPRKRCSENMQQIYRRTPMPKCEATLLKSHIGMGVLL